MTCRRLSLLVHLGLVCFIEFIHAARLDSWEHADLDLPPSSRKLLASPDSLVCGGSTIGQLLSAPTSADEVRNIPWSQVYAIVDEYLKSQGAEVAKQQAEVDRLKLEIPRREKMEAARPITKEQIGASVVAGLAAGGSYGSLDAAKASKCGAVLVKPRPPRTAFQTAVAAFTTSITSLLSSGSISVQGQTFRAECDSLLGSAAPGEVTNCAELCQQFAEKAQGASDRSAGAKALNGRTSDQLRRDLDDTTALLKVASAGLEGCQQTKADLDVFKTQLLGLQVDVKDTHEKLMGARDALMDAQYELQDAEDALHVQDAESAKAKQVLQGAGDVAKDALTKFQAAELQSAGLQSNLNAATTALQSAVASLKTSQEATDALNRLKSLVSDSMLKMVMYFDEAVRKPVRNMGLGESVTIDSLFPASLPALASAKASRVSVESLSSFCKLPETQQALAAAATEQADTRSLCLIGEVPDIVQDIDGAVSGTMGVVKTSLREVQSWLDPYRGEAGASAALAAEDVRQGAPVGLHEIIAMFGATTYYRQYLQHWALKGKFLQLYNALFQALKQAEVAHGEATGNLAAVSVRLAESLTAQADARASLEAAVAARQVAEGQEAAAQKLLQEMAATAAAAKANSDELERAVAEATRRWEAAKSNLQATHQAGVSLLEALSALEEDV